MKALYKKGDLVTYKASFLRSTGWYTNVPINGLVMADQEAPQDLVRVQWCDVDYSIGVHPANILLYNSPDCS